MYFESTINYWTDNPDGFKPPRIPIKRTKLYFDFGNYIPVCRT